MSIREFNREYSMLGVEKCNHMTAEEEMQLHCLMVRTISDLNANDLNENDMSLVTLLTNIHKIIAKEPNNSAVIWGCVDTLNKTIAAIPNKQFILNRLRVLPILTDMLEISSQLSTTECILKMLHDVTFGAEITVVEPFLEKLLQIIVDIIVGQNSMRIISDAKPQHNDAVKRAALLVLINVCCNNMAPLALLSEKINFVDFQKQVSIERYGILACKTNLILNDCGHIINETDIRNFLCFASKEVLKCMTNQDETTVKHLIGFLKDMASRTNTRHVLREYNFLAEFEAAIMMLDNQDSDRCSVQIASLFEISSIILETKNHSLANMRLTILNFAQRHMKTQNCCVEALKTLISIFEFDEHVSTTNFELSELNHSLMEILTGNDFKPHIMVPLLKLLVVLGLKYKVQLLNNVVVTAILRPLMSAKEIVHSKLKKEDVTMYLQCLVTVLKLSQIQLNQAELKVNVFNDKNVRYIVAMAIKNGNKEQRILALDLLKAAEYFPPSIMADLISETIFESNDTSDGATAIQCSPSMLMSSTIGSNNSRSEISNDDFNRLLNTIQKACDENKLNKLPVFDFIKLYEDRIITLNERVAMLNNKLQVMSKEITVEKHTSLRFETTMMKCTELAKSLQRSNELLMEDKLNANKLNTKMRHEINMAADEIKQQKSALKKKIEVIARLETSMKDMKDANMKTIFDLQNTIKEKTAQIDTLESELKETENLRHTIISLVQSKRKK